MKHAKFVASFGVVLAFSALYTLMSYQVGVKALSASANDIPVVYGEAMQYTRQGIAQSGRQGASMFWDSIGSGQINLTKDTDKISVIAKATTCAGGPVMEIYVDGDRVLSKEVGSSDYAKYETDLKLAKGIHNLTITFLNDKNGIVNGAQCDRNLSLDKIEFINTPVVVQEPTQPTSQALYPYASKPAYRYVYSAATKYAQWRAANPNDIPYMKKIADQPSAIWLGYSTDTTTLDQVMKEVNVKKQIPIFVLYKIPNRDNGQYAAAGGGAKNFEEYKAWIDMVASKIGSSNAIVVLEPDALGQGITGIYRKDSLSYATKKLGAMKNIKTYIDATNSGWYGADWKVDGEKKMAQMLQTVGIASVTGFVTNVSNFQTTQAEINYGNRLLAELGKLSPDLAKKRFIIDTSRNGNGPRPKPATEAEKKELANEKHSGEYFWCNPPGRALGVRPSLDVSIYSEFTNKDNVDAFTWIKEPGSVDGECRGSVKDDGNVWVPFAIELARNAKW